MTTQETIAEVRRLDAAAATGPWYVVEPRTDEESSTAGGYIIAEDNEGQADYVAEGRSSADHALIAFYRTAAPALADAVEAQADAIDRLCDWLDEAIGDGLSSFAASQRLAKIGIKRVNGKWRIEE